MGLTVKPLQIGEKSRTKFRVHKSYDILRENSSSFGVETYLAEYQTGSMISWNTSSSDPTTTNGIYRNIIHHSINTMFYRNYTNHPDETLSPGGSTPQNQKRILDRKATVISIAQKRYGEKIFEGSFKLQGKNSVTLIDDKQGNLIDSGIPTTNMIPSSSEIFRLSFNETHEFIGEPMDDGARYRKEYQQQFSGSRYPYITNFQLDDTSVKRVPTKAYNMQYAERDGTFGTHAIFSGEQNLHGASYRGQGNYIQTIRQVKERQDFNYVNGDDFAVAFWVNLPTSQSVTQSFHGNEPPATTNLVPYATTTFDHDTNVIIEKASNSRYRDKAPFIIETYNQRIGDVDVTKGGDVGKLVLKRGRHWQTLHDATPQLTSSAQLNDGKWHHVVYQYQTGSNEFWIDGIKQTSASDGALGNTIKNTPITIGAHVRGWTTASITQQVIKGEVTDIIQWGWQWQGGYENSSPKNVTQALSASIDEVRIFNTSLTSAQIAFLSESNNTNQVGNIFYRSGFACLTHPNIKYQEIMDDLNFEINFKGCTQLTELEYVLNVKSHEFDASENITLRKNEDPDSIDMKDFATSSHFSPYISTIGLYNDQLDLLGIAKLAQPLKKPTATDVTFIVRMDIL